MSRNKEWEYKVINLHGYTSEMREEKLNELGKKGWELTGGVAKNGGAYLKREKEIYE